MPTGDSWQQLTDALGFAVSRIEGDPDPLNDRERADGNLYVMRMLTAVTQSTTLTLDPDRPSFLTMLDGVRFVGAAGPDIDYDVAAVRPEMRYRISGQRGDATFVGICVYAGAGAAGASAIVASVDVDDIANDEGGFEWEFSHPEAARVIVRQYFHDRASQARGSWTIERVDADWVGQFDSDSRAGASPSDELLAARLMGSAEMDARVANAAKSLQWQDTIAGNTSTSTDPLYSGGGVYFTDRLGPIFKLSDTIIAGNSAAAGPADFGAGEAQMVSALMGSSDSLLGEVDSRITVAGAGNVSSTTPGVGALANNGGPTKTMALLADSAALDAGPATVATFPGNTCDQRGAGFARVVGTRADIGAFETQLPEPTTTTTASGEPEVPAFTG